MSTSTMSSSIKQMKLQRKVLEEQFTLLSSSIELLMVKSTSDNPINLNDEFASLRQIVFETQHLEGIVFNAIKECNSTDGRKLTRIAKSYAATLNEMKDKLAFLSTKKALRDQQLRLLIKQSDQHKELIQKFNKTIQTITKFDGEILKWMPFWSVFESIHQHKMLDRGEKFEFLLKCIEPNSKPGALVQSFTPATYEEAVAALQHRFARKELLVAAYTSEIIDQGNASRKKPVHDFPIFADKMYTCLSALYKLEAMSPSTALKLTDHIESSFQLEVLQKWMGLTFLSQMNPDVRLIRLMSFLEEYRPPKQPITEQNDGKINFLATVNLFSFKGKMYLKPFTVRDIPWRIVMQKGILKDTNKPFIESDRTIYFGIYLICDGKKEDFASAVTLKLTLHSRKPNDCESISKEYNMKIDLGGRSCASKRLPADGIINGQNGFLLVNPTFIRSEEGKFWSGDSKFIKWSDLIEPKNGFIKNDLIEVEVDVTVDALKPTKTLFESHNVTSYEEFAPDQISDLDIFECFYKIK